MLPSYFAPLSPTQRRSLLAAIGLTGLLACVLTVTSAANASYIKQADQNVLGASTKANKITIDSGQLQQSVDSTSTKAQFSFNAIAPHWQEQVHSGQQRQFFIRTSTDGQHWTKWMNVDMNGPQKQNDPHPDEVFPETPIMVVGQYFQYRVVLKRQHVQDASPQLSNLHMTYIDSREPTWHKVVSGLVKPKVATALASGSVPHVISRVEWGSPDPDGHLFSGDALWRPSYAPVKQIVIHHTVDADNSSDPAAVVRAIWEYHTYTRGWGDIGYNYLVDQNGTIYEGRMGGDNVVGGHAYNFNQGSMGVAMIGCFQSDDATCQQLNGGTVSAPSAAMINGLESLLAWKTTSYGIDPNVQQQFCGTQSCLNLWTIAGHRDLDSTACPGDLLYNQLPAIRSQVASMKQSAAPALAAQQLSYNLIDISHVPDSVSVTLQFKNMGTATWTNSGNQLLLKTAHPDDQPISLQGDGWIDSTTPATLTQASVAPGQTGSFTFNLKRLPNEYADYWEYFRLVLADGTDFGDYSAVMVTVQCTIGQASNLRPNGMLLQDPNSVNVYEVINNQLDRVDSPVAMYSNGFTFSQVAKVTADDINQYQLGPTLFIGEGTLVRATDGSAVYIIDKIGTVWYRRWVTSPTAMANHGLSFNWVYPISDAELNQYPIGSNLDENSPMPDGVLIVDSSNGKAYVIDQGQKRWIISAQAFISHGYKWDHLISLSSNQLNAIPNGPSVVERNGSLIMANGTAAVYIVDSTSGTAIRRHITDPYSFGIAGLQWSAIQTVPQSELDLFTDGDVFSCHY